MSTGLFPQLVRVVDLTVVVAANGYRIFIRLMTRSRG
jgi:hypothetical protein